MTDFVEAIKPTLSQLRRFIGNPGVWAAQNSGGEWHPRRHPLTDRVLTRHMQHVETVGTYIGHSTPEGTVARTLCFDIDNGSLPDAEAIEAALLDLGFPKATYGTEFSGMKGYHVWVLLQEYRPSHELRRVGRAVLALASVQCEVYPKQDEVRDLGNLVKLPGGLHRVTKKPNDFVNNVPRPLPVASWAQLLERFPPEVRARQHSADSRFPCMTAISAGVAEGGRNNQLYHLAVMLRRAGVADEFVDMIIAQVNERCQPPLEDVELEGSLESSRTGGPICGQIPEDKHCGDLCLLARTAGLYARPGQLRHAADGENVVVTLLSRKGSMIEFSHDDVGRMKAQLRLEK